MTTLVKSAIKGSAIQSPSKDPESQLKVLHQVKEAVEIGQRLRGDPNDSFVRVSELVRLGLARVVNGTLQPYASSGVSTAPVSSSRNIFTIGSILGGGNLSHDLTLALDGDATSPGGNLFYGTNAGGAKGWQPGALDSLGANWVASTGPVITPANDVLRLVARACTLKEVVILTSGGPGSCTVDILKSTLGGFPPSVSICGGTPPAIVAGNTYSNSTLAGWTTAFAQDDCLLFRITASATFTQVVIFLRFQ